MGPVGRLGIRVSGQGMHGSWGVAATIVPGVHNSLIVSYIRTQHLNSTRQDRSKFTTAKCAGKFLSSL